ncbi:MAG TPA: glucose 1-dehydrogenase [Acidimicrobiales bacterium]|jgi:NAD(P)-dependent dehydrogenase (short-subunit alcohol dehydrogenase family)
MSAHYCGAMGSLEGKVAVVTGGAMGIGRASAEIFAREGASVVVADIDEVGGQQTVATIEANGGRASFIRTDVSVKADVAQMVEHAVDTFGGLDCAHNNAGLAAPMAPLADYPDDGWDRTLAVMLTGVYHCMKAEIPLMLERGGGAIVNTASGVGLVGYPQQAAYTASKHGVIGLTKVAALDYGSQGVRVNAICPGTARTPMVERAIRYDPSIDDQLKALHPLGRIAEASEIAEAAVWLCTPAASFVLGVALPVDGGYVVP